VRPAVRSSLPVTKWFLTSVERGNASTVLDARHRDGLAWTEGNLVRPLIHGSTYFAELHNRVSQMRDGDLLMFVLPLGPFRVLRGAEPPAGR
jgi:hypothetical protein